MAVKAPSSDPSRQKNSLPALPEEGAVLGIDPGYSATAASTGFCCLWWNRDQVDWRCAHATMREDDRRRALESVLGRIDRPLLAAAIDGPLRPGLRLAYRQRCPDALLGLGVLQKRGKPGHTNSPDGWQLHSAATGLAHLVEDWCDIAPATWPHPVSQRQMAETFPNLFLGFLCDEAAYPENAARRWTDVLYSHPQVRARLAELTATLLPGRASSAASWEISHHDRIAALVCALAALGGVAGEGMLAGSPSDGWILLPPRRFWGASVDHPEPWPERVLRQNLERIRPERYPDAALYEGGNRWL